MLKVGLVQTRTPAAQEAAFAHTAPLVRQAAAGGASLIVTPECSNIVQRERAKLFAVLAPADADPFVTGMSSLARELSVWLLIGSALVKRGDGKAANRSILVAPDGSVSATYDKIHMFDVDLPNGERYRESSAYEPGDKAVTATAAGAVLGLTICYDMRFPSLYAAIARAGAQVITVPAAFTRPTGEAHWEILLRARAIETGSFVLAAAQGGFHEDGRGTWGRSVAIGPWGDILAMADHDEPGVVLADLDLEAVAKARSAIPALGNARTFAAPACVAP
jgi:predicted amidohydrolase